MNIYLVKKLMVLIWYPLLRRTNHPIPLLEKGQSERIWRLRLIVYHHNLHMWYMVVYIGVICGIGVLLEVLPRLRKWNIWFLHFNFFMSHGDMAIFFSKFHFLHFKFQKWLFFSIFSISLLWYGHFFSKFKNKNFQFRFKNEIFSFQILLVP
jgi:hypothetical protein